MLLKNVVVVDDEGQVSVRGRAELRERYSAVFAAVPTARVEIGARIRVASYVIAEEHVSGHPAGDLRAAAIYRLGADGLIEHVRFLS